MRWMSLFIAGVFFISGGCATAPQAEKRQPPPIAQAYEGAIAASLAIEPSLLVGEPALNLARDLRGQAAYAGYEDTVFTHFYLYQDDRQLNYGTWNNDRFERSAITQKVGVSYR